MNIKIQSFSGIITNSSTEVFMLFHHDNIDAVKNLVTSILQISNPDLKFDDLFEFRFVIDDYAIEELFEDYKNYPFLDDREFQNYDELSDYLNTLSNFELCEIQREFDDGRWDSGLRFFCGINIIPKDEKAAEAARLISGITDIFDLDYCY